MRLCPHVHRARNAYLPLGAAAPAMPPSAALKTPAPSIGARIPSANTIHRYGLPQSAQESGSHRLYHRLLTHIPLHSPSHALLNRMNFTSKTPPEKKVAACMTLLRALRRPTAS